MPSTKRASRSLEGGFPCPGHVCILSAVALQQMTRAASGPTLPRQWEARKQNQVFINTGGRGNIISELSCRARTDFVCITYVAGTAEYAKWQRLFTRGSFRFQNHALGILLAISLNSKRQLLSIPVGNVQSISSRGAPSVHKKG